MFVKSGDSIQEQLDFLVKGESVLGDYHVRLARHGDEGWCGVGPRLSAVVTNERLLLMPQTFRPYPPASIPRRYVDGVWNVGLGRRDGVRVSLSLGYQLYMLVSWGHGNKFAGDLKLMVKPKQTRLAPVLLADDLFRLIHYLDKL
jgi:hypothetical protein